MGPKWYWAAPLMALPAVDVSIILMRSVLQTKCKWWCRARWYADRLHVHPAASAAVWALRRCASTAQSASRCLTASVGAAAAWLGLRAVWVEDGAPWLHYGGDDARLIHILARTAVAQGRPNSAEERRRIRAGADEAAAHVFRHLPAPRS